MHNNMLRLGGPDEGLPNGIDIDAPIGTHEEVRHRIVRAARRGNITCFDSPDNSFTKR